jgi:hypothetical protein
MAEKLVAKPVASPEEAHQAIVSPEPQIPRRVWRFRKRNHGGEQLTLSDGREFVFHVAVHPETRAISGTGTFETEDEALAKLLQELVVKQPWKNVEEVTE